MRCSSSWNSQKINGWLIKIYAMAFCERRGDLQMNDTKLWYQPINFAIATRQNVNRNQPNDDYLFKSKIKTNVHL